MINVEIYLSKNYSKLKYVIIDILDIFDISGILRKTRLRPSNAVFNVDMKRVGLWLVSQEDTHMRENSYRSIQDRVDGILNLSKMDNFVERKTISFDAVLSSNTLFIRSITIHERYKDGYGSQLLKYTSNFENIMFKSCLFVYFYIPHDLFLIESQWHLFL